MSLNISPGCNYIISNQQEILSLTVKPIIFEILQKEKNLEKGDIWFKILFFFSDNCFSSHCTGIKIL